MQPAFNLATYVTQSTQASGVPLLVTDSQAVARIASQVALRRPKTGA